MPWDQRDHQGPLTKEGEQVSSAVAELLGHKQVWPHAACDQLLRDLVVSVLVGAPEGVPRGLLGCNHACACPGVGEPSG